MTITESDEMGPATGKPATDADDASGAPQVARARDGILADIHDALPDTESVRRALEDLRERFTEVIRGFWSGEIWDIQPPSPRELIDRVLEGPWNTSGERGLVFLARAGMVLALLWSVPLYTLAVASQRFWRATTAVALTALILHLL